MMLCDELKDYDIMDIEAMDDERLEKSESGKIQVTRVYIKSEVDAAIAELKEVYKDSVDVKVKIWERCKKAEDELRKTQRALWLARANDASSFAGLFSTLSYIEDDETRTYWIFGNKRKIVIDGLKCSRMETAYKWFCIWDDVANKCLKKAKAYK